MFASIPSQRLALLNMLKILPPLHQYPPFFNHFFLFDACVTGPLTAVERIAGSTVGHTSSPSAALAL